MKNQLQIVFILLLSLGLSKVAAQDNLLDEKVYSFEQGDNWSTAHNSNWTRSSEQASHGSFSMKYTVDADKVYADAALYSLDTKHTIQKVRSAEGKKGTYIVVSAYEGTVMGVSYDGIVLWKNELSGYMNHDLWCGDLTGDGIDEILVANANGVVYCIDHKGKSLWEFSKNEAPMYAICVVHKEDTPYVVCGGFDLSVYYLNAEGEEVKELKSSTYSNEKPWGEEPKPAKFVHMSNFLRPVKKADGSEALAIVGTNNHMQVAGTVYLFDVLADEPYQETKVVCANVVGDFRAIAQGNSQEDLILIGSTGHNKDMSISYFLPSSGEMIQHDIENLGFGYNVTQSASITDNGVEKIMVLAGKHFSIFPKDFSTAAERHDGKYAFNDMWKDDVSGKLLLASLQSGGSCIHIVDTEKEGWEEMITTIQPIGKIQRILDNTASYRSQLAGFTKPEWQREQLPVYMMTETFKTPLSLQVKETIEANYTSPLFLGGEHMPKVEDWDRSAMENEKYRDRRDKRKQYVLSQQEVWDLIFPWFNNVEGIAYWGGHGNDPYMFQLETTKGIIDEAKGKKTVLIYPEMTDLSDDFAWVMEDLFYPMAEYGKDKGLNIYVRSKHTFWQASVYTPVWKRVLDGDFADVFVPSMEETTDKSMDLSLSSRIGLWASGSVNSWGSRSVPDNPSFDRSRQFSHQMLPNHFLRQMVYAISSGAQYINNFPVDQDYMSFLWELIAKGALYVPQRDEIVSFSPVHLSINEPDEYFMNEGNSVKWSAFYDEQKEAENKLVFSHLNGSWPAAPVTEWDFSRYAAGVKDRRQHFIPNYNNGLVLMTPVQNGAFAAENPTRGQLTDHLHPIYKDIMTEYITDGRNYYSTDGTETYPAEEYYTTIESDIKTNKTKLPLTVEGEVGWVVAQVSPTHLRLTIIDNGYLNPDDREAKITFHTVKPKNMKDIIDNTSFDISNPNNVLVDVPCGLFRFIDIELTEEL